MKRVITIWRQAVTNVEVLYTDIPMPEPGIIIGVFLQLTISSVATGGGSTWLTTSTSQVGGTANSNDQSFAQLIENHRAATAVGIYESAKELYLPCYIRVARGQIIQWGRSNSDGTAAFYCMIHLQPDN